MLNIRTILHPTDFSENSAHAFELACALARDFEARLLVLYVAEPVVVAAAELPMILPVVVDTGEEARVQLEALRPNDPIIRVEHLYREGDPAGEILCAAEECHADLIVMGTHGRSGISRLLLGSVAEAVLRKAPCPVLTIKEPSRVAAKASERAHATVK
jgi:nucleotide-binding universal stress UspA family protein